MHTVAKHVGLSSTHSTRTGGLVTIGLPRDGFAGKTDAKGSKLWGDEKAEGMIIHMSTPPQSALSIRRLTDPFQTSFLPPNRLSKNVPAKDCLT